MQHTNMANHHHVPTDGSLRRHHTGDTMISFRNTFLYIIMYKRILNIF